MTGIRKFILKYSEFFTITGLCILFYFIFFHNIWAYPLMDVDETRYVSMAKDMFNTKDFMTLYLNKEFFFEKPPLYFWGECLSFALFGKITEATARFPVALYGTLCGFITYFTGRKIYGKTFGLISALILATSLEFVILAKFAILDIVVTTCVWFSLCFGMLTYFCKEQNKKYFWWLFYIFSGLAVMAKGIPGFVVPFGSMFFISIFSKNFKEIFKPQYFLVGFALFFAITLPWHIIMLNIHNPLFFNEYIMKHHVARFFDSNALGRTEPFYFYFLTILWGFFPWIISSFCVLIRKIVHKDLKFKNLTDIQKFMVFNAIIAVFTLLFFSSSKTKLITYILPVYGSLSFLAGYIWTNYIRKDEYSRIINPTVYFIGWLFIIASVVAIFTPYFLPNQLYLDILDAKWLCIILLFLCGLCSVVFAKKERYVLVFLTYVIFMTSLSAFGTEKFFKIDYKFGQNDIMKYAQYAKENNKTVTCFQFTHKYSLLFYGAKEPVVFGLYYDINDLKAELNKKDNIVIIPKKRIDDKIRALNYKVLDEGRKYILTEGK